MPQTATFTVATAGSVAVSASASTATAGAPTIAVTGALPAGLAFRTAGGGQATISGAPMFQAVGTSTVTVTATMPTGASASGTAALTVVPEQPEADWVRAPNSAVRTYAGATFSPIATYAESEQLAATPNTVYLWTQGRGIPSLQQTPQSLAAWEHDGNHAYPQFTTYRVS